MFWTRVVSGAVLAPLFLALVYWEKPFFHIMVAAITGIMAYEFLRMDGKAGPKRQVLTIAGIVAAVLAMVFMSSTAALLLGAAVGLVAIASDKAAGRKERHVAQIAVPYVLLPALSLLYLMDVGGAPSVFWLLAVIWATDIGAYVCGRLIGGPKLAPAVSPKKTWSGAVGGLIWAVIASSGVYWAYQGAIAPKVALLALLLSVISQAGDLFESSLKRRYDVKDSGALIPGHGGLMDRFDGLWAAAPFAAVFCVILGGGMQHW